MYEYGGLTSIKTIGQFEEVVRWEGLVKSRNESVAGGGFPPVRSFLSESIEVVLAGSCNAVGERMSLYKYGWEVGGWA